MATDHNSPNNGHDVNDEDFPEVLQIIDNFDNSPLEKQQKLIQRMRDLAKEYKDRPTLAEVCRQLAKDLQHRIGNTSSDNDKQG